MENVNLLDICDVYQPQTIATKYFVVDGQHTVYGANGAIGLYNKYNHEDSEVLMACRGASCGAINISKPFSWINGNAMVIKPKNDEILHKDYLSYCLQAIDISKVITGTAQPQITRNNLKKLQIPVTNIKEQERIVAKIEELFSDLDNAVWTLKLTERKLELYRQSVIKEAFTGAFTNDYRKVNDTSIDIELPWLNDNQVSGLPQIPKTWRYILLSNLGDLGRGKSKHRPRNDVRLFENGEYPFLQTSEVKAADKFITEYSKKYNDFGLAQSKLWPAGTLCITIAANIAETAFLGIDACFPDSVVGFTPSNEILSEYIRYFIESQKARLSAFAPATAQKNINLTTLENLVIPYCSLKEQKRIVDEIESRLTAYLNIEKTVNDALQQASAMRQSILKQAFEGRLL